METPQVMADDWSLVSAYVGGDEKAFELLVAKYFRMVHAIAARQVGDLHLAEEVAQSVFILFSRKAAKLSSSVSIAGWLAQTARFVSRDAIKMRRRRSEHEQRFAASLDSRPPGATDPGSVEAMLDEALLALSANEQAGVIAHFIEGKNFKEVGQMFAIGEDAAQKRVSRSVDKLRNFLLRRGAKVPVTALAGLLAASAAREASAQAMQAAAGGKFAGPALDLANRAARLLRWRAMKNTGVKVAAVALLAAAGFWAIRGWDAQRLGRQIEGLGQAYSRVVLQFDDLKQGMATGKIAPANVQPQIDALGQQADRIGEQLAPLLVAPHERDSVADFLTSEVNATIGLEPSERAAVHQIVRERLSRGATLKEAEAGAAADTPAIAAQIKGVLTAQQQQRFDRMYGVDASGFFTYLKSASGPQGKQGQK